MSALLGEIELQVSGLGIIMYSPSLLPPIRRGEDFLASGYEKEENVQTFLQAGTLVAFGTGTPGLFHLRFYAGPADRDAQMKLRLGIRVIDNMICVRELYDLLEWEPTCPPGQSIHIPNGTYRITIRSDVPPSGRVGDQQVIDLFFEKWPAMPALTRVGIPTLGHAEGIV